MPEEFAWFPYFAAAVSFVSGAILIRVLDTGPLRVQGADQEVRLVKLETQNEERWKEILRRLGTIELMAQGGEKRLAILERERR